MDLAHHEGLTVVSLSRRNVERLLRKLNEGEPAPSLTRVVEGEGRLIVSLQEDAGHYGDREPGQPAES